MALAGCLLVFMSIRRVDGEPSLSGTPVGVDTISNDLAVRIMRDPVAGSPCSAVALGSGRRSVNALWADAECPSDGGQRGKDAGCWNAIYIPPGEYDVACC